MSSPIPETPRRQVEVKYYGLHSCMQMWNKRPQDVIRVFVDKNRVTKFTPLLKWSAERRLVYRLVTEEELEKISGSSHHEGICIVGKEKERGSFELFLLNSKNLTSSCILFLDGVENPHNVGSIVRSASHFGITHILTRADERKRSSGSVGHTARGASEDVEMLSVYSPEQALTELRAAGFMIIGTSSHKGGSLYEYAFPPKTVLVVGSESHGVSREVLRLANHLVNIPGSGKIESLNVGVATALLFSEYRRRNPL